MTGDSLKPLRGLRQARHDVDASERQFTSDPDPAYKKKFAEFIRNFEIELNCFVDIPDKEFNIEDAAFIEDCRQRLSAIHQSYPP